MIQKKKFPSIKKSIKNFLTDESGKITKKDALGLSLGGIIASSVDNIASAGHNSSYPTSQSPGTYDFYPTEASVYPNSTDTKTYTLVTGATCNHASGIVNGHFSSNPSVSTTSESIDFTKSHSSHGSHGNHESGGWC